MTFDPAPGVEGRRGLMVTAALLLMETILVVLGFSLTVGAAPFLILMVALVLLIPLSYVAWRTWLCLSLSYWLDRNAVTIAWGPLRQIIPLGHIQRIRRGAATVETPSWRDRWPRMRPLLEYGPDLGRVWTLDNTQVASLASRPAPEQLLFVTDQGIFGISPADPNAFLKALEEHRRLGPTRLLAMERRVPRLATSPLWQDRLGVGMLVASFVGWLLLLGIAMTRFPSLPLAMESLDGADRRWIFALPAFGLVVWLVNGVWGLLTYERQRIASWLLWGGSLVVEAAILVALLSLST